MNALYARGVSPGRRCKEGVAVMGSGGLGVKSAELMGGDDDWGVDGGHECGTVGTEGEVFFISFLFCFRFWFSNLCLHYV